MQRSTAKRRVATAAPQAAIALKPAGAGDERAGFGRLLVVFMRVAAMAWIAQGLIQWAAVLGTGADGASPFAALAPPAMVATVFFAVVDFVAAVGLWLAAPWGGVIWLAAVAAQVLVAVLMPDTLDHPRLTVLADAALVAGYLALVWAAARDGDAEG